MLIRRTARISGVVSLSAAAMFSFMGVPAASAQPITPAPTPSAPSTSAPSIPAPEQPATAGLAEALQRDAGMSVEQFIQQGATTEQAKAVSDELAARDIAGRVLTRNDAVVVQSTDARAAQLGTAYNVAVEQKNVDARPQTVQSMLDAYLDEVGAEGLLALGTDETGYVIQVKGINQAKRGRAGHAPLSPVDFAKRYSNVAVKEAAGPAKATADDVYGGQGFQSANTICSTGFNFTTGTGDKVMATAGHCWDGSSGPLVPDRMSSELVMGGAGTQKLPAGAMGEYIWGMYGANTPGSAGSDLALFSLNSSYNYPTQVTTWQNRGTVPVTGYISDPQTVMGKTACRSGRTTGWQCGTVNYVGYVAVTESTTDTRLIWSVGATMRAAGGDSGGAMLVGTKALGITSATGTTAAGSFTSAALVSELLVKYRTDLRLNISLNTPALVNVTSSTPAWAAGTVVTGTVPNFGSGDSIAAGTTVTAVLSSGWKIQVPVSNDGSFSFTYNGPTLTGKETLDVVATNAASSSAHGIIVVQGLHAIDARWQVLGGAAGMMGKAASPIQFSSDGKSAWRTFDGGSIYWTASAGAWEVRGAIGARYSAIDAHYSYLGYPQGPEQCGNVKDGCSQTFERGVIFWVYGAGAWDVHGAMLARFQIMGGVAGALGYPTTGERCGLLKGGCAQTFQGGVVYWAPGIGAWTVHGAIGARYAADGAEQGYLGYPSGAERCGLSNGGCVQSFEGGLIYWIPNAGTVSVHGAVGARYIASGAEAGYLGYPLEGERCGLRSGGCVQLFQNGRIYWAYGAGAWSVHGGIGARYLMLGGENSSYGYPTSAEYVAGGRPAQNFQYGIIYF